jgi:hypothetical protein
MVLTLTVYVDEDGDDRFKVYWTDDPDSMTDVTDDYEVFTCEMEDGRTGTMLVKRER